MNLLYPSQVIGESLLNLKAMTPLTLTWRTMLGWTQNELAVRLRVRRQTVSDLLHEGKYVTA